MSCSGSNSKGLNISSELSAVKSNLISKCKYQWVRRKRTYLAFFHLVLGKKTVWTLFMQSTKKKFSCTIHSGQANQVIGLWPDIYQIKILIFYGTHVVEQCSIFETIPFTYAESNKFALTYKTYCRC